MSGWNALYIFMLAAFTGYVVISAVPVILHTPLMSGSNFVHGIVLVGAMIALGFAQTGVEQAIGIFAVALAAMNVFGGYVVTVRMLAMFKSSRERERPAAADSGGSAGDGGASGAGSTSDGGSGGRS
jgi:NAD(P) transhydrogenase subunit alpha